jgi:hypothetical protein
MQLSLDEGGNGWELETGNWFSPLLFWFRKS